MPTDANLIQSIHLLLRSGKYTVPADSGIGDVQRPQAGGQNGGRTATLETFFDFFINNVPDPDEALANDPNIEYKLRTHPDVAANFIKRAFTVSSMPWRIEPNPRAIDKHAAAMVADHCTNVVKAIPNFEQAIEMLEYAVLVGGQGLEFVWHQENNGVEYPVSWQPIHKSRFCFDRLGNAALLTRDQAVWGAYIATDPQSQYQFKGPLPQGKFVYHVYRKGQGTWANPPLEGYIYHGYGEDVALYYVLMFDIFCLKYRMKFLERYGLPPMRVYAPDNLLFSPAMRRIADSLRGESLTKIPFKAFGGTVGGTTDHNNQYKVEDVQAPSGSFDYFDSHTNGYTKPRIKAILIGDDSGDKEETKGGYSSDVSKRDSGPNVFFRRDAKIIGSTFTTQLMPSIALGRFPNLPAEYFPIFSMEPKEEKDRKQELDIIKEAREVGLPITRAHAYDAADLPAPKPGEELLEAVQPAQQPLPNGVAPNGSGNGSKFGIHGMSGERMPVGHVGGNGSIAENQ